MICHRSWISILALIFLPIPCLTDTSKDLSSRSHMHYSVSPCPLLWLLLYFLFDILNTLFLIFVFIFQYLIPEFLCIFLSNLAKIPFNSFLAHNLLLRVTLLMYYCVNFWHFYGLSSCCFCKATLIFVFLKDHLMLSILENFFLADWQFYLWKSIPGAHWSTKVLHPEFWPLLMGIAQYVWPQ